MLEIIAVLKQKTLNTSCTAAAMLRVWVYAGTWAKQVEEAELLVHGVETCFVVWKPWDYRCGVCTGEKSPSSQKESLHSGGR